MEALIQKITEMVKPVYTFSAFYSHTIWPHALRVSGYAKDLAAKIKANQFIAEAGGLLHDFGAAMYGQNDHHITGVKEAVPVLLKCGCPLKFIGPIITTIYSHRGSQKIAFRTQEARCVAAADAQDHFTDLEELWEVQKRDLGIMEEWIHQALSKKLERDWEKISPEIKILLDGTFEKAKRELLRIAHMNGTPVGNK